MFLPSVANGAQKSSSQGSDSNSSASSLSSGTPVSSLSGLSQVMFPPSLSFSSDMVDVCISTEDRRSEGLSLCSSNLPHAPEPTCKQQTCCELDGSFSRSERMETAIQTDQCSQRVGADTTHSRGRTTLLKDTVICGDEGSGRKESTKTAVLLALSRPSRPISRSQSQVTVAGEANKRTRRPDGCEIFCEKLCCVIAEITQKKEKKKKGKDTEEKSPLQRSKTFVNLLFRSGRKRDTSRGRSKPPSDDKASRGTFLPVTRTTKLELRACSNIL